MEGGGAGAGPTTVIVGICNRNEQRHCHIQLIVPTMIGPPGPSMATVNGPPGPSAAL